MKLTTFITLLACLTARAAVSQPKVTLNEKHAGTETIFSNLEKQSGLNFFYKIEILKSMPLTDINVHNVTLSQALDQILKDKPLSYAIVENTVVIIPKEIKAEKKEILSITGTVVDESGKPISGITVTVKPNGRPLQTANDGKFTVLLIDEKTSVIQFTCVGYQTQEIKVKAPAKDLLITMKQAVGTLDQVQVMAYGTTTKKLSTGNIVTISAEEIAKSPVSNVLQAIQNKIPGFFTQQSTGTVGGAFNTKIRGNSSIGANQPLFIIDGVQYQGGQMLYQLGSLKGGNNVFNGGSGLNYINPDDIESFSVLKDAEATSLYGSRGAYGVVLITTKKAKGGESKFSVNAYAGISTIGFTPDLLTTDEYLNLRREALKNDNVPVSASDLDLNGTWPIDRYNDFRKYYLGGNAFNQNVNLSYSGGSANTNFLVSGNFRNQKSLQLGKGGNIDGGGRFDLNNTSKSGKFFLDLTGSYNLTRNDAVPFDFTTSLYAAPNSPLPILPDGSLDWSQGTNGAAAANANYLGTTSNFISNLTIRYDFLKNLSFNMIAGINVLRQKELRQLPTSYFVPSVDVATKTTSYFQESRTNVTTIDPNLSYRNIFLKKLNVSLIAGFTIQNQVVFNSTIIGQNFSSDALLNTPSAGSVLSQVTYSSTPNAYIGAFGRVSLNWANKYLFSANFRRDGSSKFGPGHRFGNFGSVAGSWIVTEEPWMKKISNIIYFMKLRGSYGTTGGDQVGNDAFLNTYNISGATYAGGITYGLQKIANPYLHYETKKNAEGGVTLQFLQGRIEVDGSYYYNTTSNSLLRQTLSKVTGFNLVTLNDPSVKIATYGYELDLSTVNIRTKNFKWRTTFNYSTPRSKLTGYPGLADATSVTQDNFNLVLGMPITALKLYNYNGVNPATGNRSYIKATGEIGDFNSFTINNTTDKSQVIDVAPQFYGGLGNTFTWKKLNLDIFLSFKQGWALNYWGQQTNSGFVGAFNQNVTSAALDRWQKPGDITDVPRATQDAFTSLLGGSLFRNSTGAYSNIFVARLQNVNLSYDLSGKWSKKIGASQLSVYAQGQNLMTFSKFKDLDPENMNASSIGPIRTYVMGLRITF